jgi:ribosomal protein S18 acetylase RimI-like enzyme
VSICEAFPSYNGFVRSGGYMGCRRGLPRGRLAGVIDLRVLTEDDWLIWRALRLAALAEAPDAFGSRLADWQGDGDREERWRGRLRIAGSYNIVAALDGQPVGMVSGVPADDGAAELISLWVSPVARGRGVGDRLITSVLDWARDQGAQALRLWVAEGNEPATALYRRNGFRDTGEYDTMPDGVRKERVMAVALS